MAAVFFLAKINRWKVYLIKNKLELKIIRKDQVPIRPLTEGKLE
jgi:hypothetical protein